MEEENGKPSHDGAAGKGSGGSRYTKKVYSYASSLSVAAGEEDDDDAEADDDDDDQDGLTSPSEEEISGGSTAVAPTRTKRAKSTTARASTSSLSVDAIAAPPLYARYPPALPVCDTAACTGKLKVISISLYGSNPRYTAGAVRNSEIARDAFPDWQLWVYIPDPSINADYMVPEDIKNALTRNGAKLIYVDKTTVDDVGFGMNQRFLPAGEATVDRFVSRDGDSR